MEKTQTIIAIVIGIILISVLGFLIYYRFSINSLSDQYPAGSPVATEFYTGCEDFGATSDELVKISMYGWSYGANPLQYSSDEHINELLVLWTAFTIQSGPMKVQKYFRKSFEQIGDSDSIKKYFGNLYQITSQPGERDDMMDPDEPVKPIWTISYDDSSYSLDGCSSEKTFPTVSISQSKIRKTTEDRVNYTYVEI